ncbi:unnamed protein product [Meganyctiphanes norvegica]|uniref:Ig-like domain-containing protein n=1 Tax=Meganyctiphanes norvegica TaxID=48144 RepID=A0AAV2PKK9_MEGNR
MMPWINSFSCNWLRLCLHIFGILLLVEGNYILGLGHSNRDMAGIDGFSPQDESAIGEALDGVPGSAPEGGVGVDPASWSDYLNELFDPMFDSAVPENVTAVEGHMAHLVCRVNNLGTKTVSWIRHHDTHILTVGSFTYTSDDRFSTLHREGTNEWTLQIKQPIVRDSGLYECQVSTKPVRAYLVQLNIVVPLTVILHGPALHANEGGALNLTCVVAPSPATPEYIFWYHGGEVINYETDGRVSVRVKQENGRTISTLLVAKATLGHNGFYECEPSNAEKANITVHVVKAKPAAMQTSSSTLLQDALDPCLLLPALLFLYHLLMALPNLMT